VIVNVQKTIFSSLHLIAPSDLSSASDAFYRMIMELNQILLLLTYKIQHIKLDWSSVCWGSMVITRNKSKEEQYKFI